MKTANLKPGDIARKKDCDDLFEVRQVFDDGYIRAVEVTDEYDKRGFCRHCTEFEQYEQKY